MPNIVPGGTFNAPGTCPILTQSDLQDPTLSKLNSLNAFIYTKVGALYGSAQQVNLGAVLNSTFRSPRQTQPPTDQDTLITLRTANALFGPDSQRTALASGAAPQGPTQPLPPIPPQGGGGSSSVAGSDTMVQYNLAGSFGADANLTWGYSSRQLNVNGSIEANLPVYLKGYASSGGFGAPSSGYGALSYDSGSNYWYWNGSAWAMVNLAAVSGSPGGTDKMVQYNLAGGFGGDAGLEWTYTGNKQLTVSSDYWSSLTVAPGGILNAGISLAPILTGTSRGGYIDFANLLYANFPVPLTGASFGGGDILMWVSGVNGTVSPITSFGINTNAFMNASAGFVTLGTNTNIIQAPNGGIYAGTQIQVGPHASGATGFEIIYLDSNIASNDPLQIYDTHLSHYLAFIDVFGNCDLSGGVITNINGSPVSNCLMNGSSVILDSTGIFEGPGTFCGSSTIRGFAFDPWISGSATNPGNYLAGIASGATPFTVTVSSTASFQVAGGSVVAWTGVSDARLKNILGKYSYGLDAILKINPVMYEWNDLEDARMKKIHPHLSADKSRMIGFLAQEVQAVMPEAAFENTDGYLGIDKDGILAALVVAVQELAKKLEH